MFNEADHYIKAATNKKPNIEVLRYSERTASSMKITAMATDGDGENLTYKLYVGTTRENLIEQTDVKENVEQGTEVSWQVGVTDSTSTYYYKIIVLDKYANIDSGIRETNNAPVLGPVTIEKDLDENIGNWVKAKVTATDQENDKLTYTFKMWKKTDGVSEEELIKQEATKTASKENVNAGEEVEITINGLEEYQDYVYRVDVADEDNNTIGTKALVKTYCSGKALECDGYSPCETCNRSGICIISSNQDMSSNYRYYGMRLYPFYCTICGGIGQEVGGWFYAMQAKCNICWYEFDEQIALCKEHRLPHPLAYSYNIHTGEKENMIEGRLPIKHQCNPCKGTGNLGCEHRH